MASVTGNVAKEYWDDFGIVGPRSQLLKHRHYTNYAPSPPLRGVNECNRLIPTLNSGVPSARHKQ